jgi:hypothetical protein
MLEKEFVPYEEAFALKKLGFNEPCLGYYLCRNSAFGIDDLKITTEQIDLIPYDYASCAVPTFSQAFRWFRDKHNLNPLIAFCEYAIESENAWKYTLDNPTKVLMWDGKFNTYEEAELACLKKLIEIKNEQQ